MTREDIIRMAFEALGAPYSSYLGKRRWDISDKQVERFAALVAASEREQCAMVCERFGQTLEVDVGDCFAEEIRARGK